MEREHLAIGAASVAGSAAAMLWWGSGGEVTIHELGHCCAGWTVYSYLPGQGPAMEVVQLDRLVALFQEPNWAHLKSYLTAGPAGAAWVHHGTPRFGLSYNARRSIVAISGSLPQLALDGTILGIGLSSDDEMVKAGCVSAALLSHGQNSIYPLDGFWSLARGLPVSSGHDFVNFATHLPINLPPTFIAGTTALFWGASLPSVGLWHAYHSNNQRAN